MPEVHFVNATSERFPNYTKEIAIPITITKDAYQGALSYQPSDKDVFICSYPKCGNTWISKILDEMIREGVSTEVSPLERVPFFEMCGTKGFENKSEKQRLLKYHLPYQLVPWSDQAKYVFVVRNPMDCVTSYFYHAQSMPGCDKVSSVFDDFFEHFLSGQGYCGDYFDFVGDWFQASKDLSNVCLVVYENFKTDFETELIKVAEFLDPSWREKLLDRDGELIKTIKENSSFERMTTSSTRYQPPMWNGTFNFVRKGVVGDWKNRLNKDQHSKLFEKLMKYDKRYKGLMDLWSPEVVGL